jgi:molybdenum cofactor cytidylyltransferase
MDAMHLGCVVMAAGNASRFGGNKLYAALEGKTLIRRALEAVPTERLERVVVVTQYPEIADAAKEFSFIAIMNHRPDLGISRTISLGLQQLADMDAVLFLVADQPLLQRASIAHLLNLARQHPGQIIAAAHGGMRGNPCLFPACFFPELLALEGDRGGSEVIRRHSEQLVLAEIPAQELLDVDTPSELERLQS